MTPSFTQFTSAIVPPAGDLPHKAFDSFRKFDTTEAAKAAFGIARDRLLHPHTWAALTDGFGAAFQLFNGKGEAISGKAAVGNYLKISIPPPANTHADWVRIEALEAADASDEQLLGLRVRPTESLEEEGHETAHFFSDSATSTWVLHRAGATVTAYYFGRGEKPNEESEGFWRTLRDKIVALAGVAGFSDLQWKAFLEGLLEEV